jgi:hypothetical protein
MEKDEKEKLDEIIAKLSEQQQKFLADSFIAEEVFEIIVSNLNIDKDDEMYQNLTIGVLKRQTRDHMILYIWENLADKQTKHFKDFLNQSSVAYPEKTHDEVLIEFALLYPDLMEKVYDSLTEFFKDFIRNFNEISGA